jgi:hypothetical protein
MAGRVTLFVFLLLFSRVLFAEVLTFLEIDGSLFPQLSRDEMALMEREDLKKLSADNLHTASGISSFIQLVTGEKVKAPHITIAFSKQNHIDNILSLDRWLLKNIDKSNDARAVSQTKKDPVRIMISDIVISEGGALCEARPITETLYVGDVHKFEVACELDRKRDNVLQAGFVLSYSSAYTLRTIGQQLQPVDIFASEPRSFSYTFETDVLTNVNITYKPL